MNIQVDFEAKEHAIDGAGWFAIVPGDGYETIGSGKTAWEAVADALWSAVAEDAVRSRPPTLCPFCCNPMAYGRTLDKEWSVWNGECSVCRVHLEVNLDTENLHCAIDAVIEKSA